MEGGGDVYKAIAIQAEIRIKKEYFTIFFNESLYSPIFLQQFIRWMVH